jgi:ligand-binding sensor domain-containing protein/serine phosphatase RsbU (regulator of sigma subunit)
MPRTSRLRKWLVSLLLLSACFLVAQRLISFRKISVNDGLSQSSIGMVIQDTRGYIWVSTADGLNRYDGYEFTVFRPDPDDAYSISSQRIGVIKEDRNQNIWVGTETSLECFDPRTGRFTHFTHRDDDSASFPKCEVRTMLFADSGLVWVGTTVGLELLDPATGKVVHLKHAIGDSTTIPSNIVQGLVRLSDGILVGTDSGMCIMNETTLEVTSITDEPFRSCNVINVDKSGRIFISGDTSLYLFTEKEKKFTLLSKDQHRGPRGDYNPGSLFGFSQDQNGICWTGGWMWLSPVEISDTGLQHVKYYSNGVWPSASAAVCVDNGMNVWSGGEGSDLLTGNIRSSRFLSYKIMAPGQSQQDLNSVWSCSEDTSGRFWVTAQRCVQRIDPRTGVSENYTLDKNNPRSLPTDGGAFHAICDSKGRVWIDCALNLCLYNEKTNDFDRYPSIKGDSTSHPPKNGSIIFEAQNGDIWLGTYGWSMVKFTPETGKFKPYVPAKGTEFAPSGYVVRSIFQDMEGTIWVGTNRGLDRFDPEEGKYYRTLENSPYASEIFGMQQTEPGYLWIGSNIYGLLKYDIANKKVIKQYIDKDGLANNTIYEIEKDNDGNLWIATNNGISRFNPQTETFRNYNHSDGILHNEFAGAGGNFSRNGWMLFGCSEGFVAFRPELMQENPFPPKVLITKMRLFNKDVGISDFKEHYNDSSTCWIPDEEMPVLPMDISFVRDIELNYDQNFISFDYVGMHYAAPEKNSYAYIMEGLEDKWNMVGQQRTATYTNLSPGEYTFRVKASNCDGVWNEEGKSIHIVVHPPWWETLWFRTLAVLALLGGVVGFFRYRTAALRRRQKELEHTVTERTAEVVHQKHMVEEKQKEIIDSINYAQRIQHALLAGDKLLQENLGDHFVLFQPKDIVAGDFYWGTNTPDGFMLITADCTGHGVPGAFMSLLNISKLSETISEKKITRPDLVLNNVRSEIIRSLNPNAGDNSQDGMDCILCRFDLKNRKLEYAAANNGFYVVRNKELVHCVADKMPVGKSHDNKTPFTLHTIELQSGDMIYTLTDGYPDQFGGPKGKKFKYKQLEEFLVQIAEQPMKAQKESLRTTVLEWRGNLEQVDDICIIGIKVS